LAAIGKLATADRVAGTGEALIGRKHTRAIVVTTGMLAFISFWRASAIVLCDMASTVYYIGGIVEAAVGKSAPYFILAVMLFSYAVRAVYVESCSMFTRGGVYRVVKEAMGSTLAKLSVSALMFDYILTGPISGVSAGQYLVGLINELFKMAHLGVVLPPDLAAAAFAILVTVYFWWQNILGIEESSGKAMRIMQVTTVMGVLMIAWCAITLYARGFHMPPTVRLAGWFICLRRVPSVRLESSSRSGTPSSRCRARNRWRRSIARSKRPS
jgi:amino acid transporter